MRSATPHLPSDAGELNIAENCFKCCQIAKIFILLFTKSMLLGNIAILDFRLEVEILPFLCIMVKTRKCNLIDEILLHFIIIIITTTILFVFNLGDLYYLGYKK